MPKQLYFIALVPDPELREKFRNMKEVMRERFGTKHALKVPAHITLQKPFRRKQDEEPEMEQILEEMASQQEPFTVQLNGFGAYPPRSIFVKVDNKEPVQQLHQELKQLLTNRLYFNSKEIQTEINPHMTIATRDLSHKAFHKAWPEFEFRVFTDSFQVKSLFLLKHNGKSWDIHKEFLFD